MLASSSSVMEEGIESAEEDKVSEQQQQQQQQECCSFPECFFCTMMIKSSEGAAPTKSYAKQAAVFSKLFKELPLLEKRGQILAVRGLWGTAMAHPDDVEFVELGILECMTDLVWKGLRNRRWLSRCDNVYIPYYAAHILGSYTMNVEAFAIRAVRAGSVSALVELLRGRMSWVEQRVAVRALSHLASYESTFPEVASASGGEVLGLAMQLAREAPGIVYAQFVGRGESRRLGYHRELLTRGGSGGAAGGGGGDMESRKAEEWASQLQCWSLQVVNCFALRDEFLLEVCRPEFLRELPGIWGGLVNGNSPAGVGLLRTICYQKLGRIAIASCPAIVEALCNVARSSDDWQYMAVDCLLWLLQDPNTRRKVFDIAGAPLADLAELGSLGEQKKPGELIMEVLLLQEQQQDQEQQHEQDHEQPEEMAMVVEEIARLRRRMKIEKRMLKEDIRIKQAAALVLRLEGNALFSAGDVAGAAAKYSEAMEVCPVKARRDRITILNNRAQCNLLMGEAERAVSDTTRALCLCNNTRGKHLMGSSLWRRAQAYDMLGLPKESLLDAIMFANVGSSGCSENSDDGWMENCSSSRSSSGAAGGGGGGVFRYVDRLVRKQMRRTWLFRDANRRRNRELLLLRECGDQQQQQQQQRQQSNEDEDEEDEEEEEDEGGESHEEEEDGSEWETASESDVNYE